MGAHGMPEDSHGVEHSLELGAYVDAVRVGLPSPRTLRLMTELFVQAKRTICRLYGGS